MKIALKSSAFKLKFRCLRVGLANIGFTREYRAAEIVLVASNHMSKQWKRELIAMCIVRAESGPRQYIVL